MNKISDAAVEAACKVVFGDYKRKTIYSRECEIEMRAALEAALPHLQPSAAGQTVFQLRSTHRVYRGSNGYLPCYCWAKADHSIGDEVKRHMGDLSDQELVNLDWRQVDTAAQPSPAGQGDAWSIAELVRGDLDRQSCPDAYMRIATESVVKHLASRKTVGHIPAGFVLVPEKFGIPADVWEGVEFVTGGPGTGEGESYLDSTAWIGGLIQDDGSRIYGLHLSCDECPEEGSVTLAEFAAPPAQAVDLGHFRWSVDQAFLREDDAFQRGFITRAEYDKAQAERDRLRALIDSSKAVQP